jgi:hypothetical protein
MLIFVAIIVLIAAVGAIYLLLKNMGQDGIEAAAPGSCKSGKCGVRNGAATGKGCHQEETLLAESDEVQPNEALQLGNGTAAIPPANNRP